MAAKKSNYNFRTFCLCCQLFLQQFLSIFSKFFCFRRNPVLSYRPPLFVIPVRFSRCSFSSVVIPTTQETPFCVFRLKIAIFPAIFALFDSLFQIVHSLHNFSVFLEIFSNLSVSFLNSWLAFCVSLLFTDFGSLFSGGLYFLLLLSVFSAVESRGIDNTSNFLSPFNTFTSRSPHLGTPRTDAWGTSSCRTRSPVTRLT